MADEGTSAPNLCFFISRIGENGSSEREQADGVMDAIVRPAAKELKMRCVRADQLPDPGQITTQIIDRIIAAKMVVADLSGGNPNVYYELAVRNSFRLPTALLAQEGERLPFDTAVMRTIFYVSDSMKSTAAARDNLVMQMKSATAGAVESPVSTAVDLASLRAGSPTDQQLASIVRKLESLTIDSREMKRLLSDERAAFPLPAELRKNLLMAHDYLQAQISDHPPPFPVEVVAGMVESVLRYVNRSSHHRSIPTTPTSKPTPSITAAMIREFMDLYRLGSGEDPDPDLLSLALRPLPGSGEIPLTWLLANLRGTPRRFGGDHESAPPRGEGDG